MKGFFKWFKSKAKMKRWIFISIIGVVLICYGMAKLVNLNRERLELYEIPFVVGAFIVGFTAVVIGIVHMQKRMLEILVEESDTRKETNNVNTLIFNKKVYNQGPKIVVIGGGSGLNTVLRGLKHYTDNITAVVTVSDYGETPTDSRKALSVLPLNDIKGSIDALSSNEEEMQKLLDVEFETGKLKGLSFSDICFLAMTKPSGNFAKSIENAGHVLNITGRVLPVTTEPITICAELEDGQVIESRDKIPEIVSKTNSKISRVYISPTNTKPTPGVLEAIEEADAIVIGPGSLYTNVIPNLLVKGIAKKIKDSKAIKVYVSNIMTEMGQTDEYTLSDHIKAIVDYIGKNIIDYCIYDTGEVIPEFIQRYNLKGADIVIPDTNKVKELGVRLIQRNLSKIDGESIRHDSDVIAMTIIQLICDELKFEDMQNDTQYMMLNSKLKETKRERRRRERKERKFQKSGRKQFERRDSNEKSKFNTKYNDRVKSIKETDEKVKRKSKRVLESDMRFSEKLNNVRKVQESAESELMKAVSKIGINKGKEAETKTKKKVKAK